MTVTTSPPSLSIPTINIAPYISDPASIEALKIVNQVRQACTGTGFFQIIGHNVPRSLQEAAFKGAAAFFALPLDEKKKLDRTIGDGPGNRGYELMGTQMLEEGQKAADLKEGFYISQDLPASNPLAKAHPQFLGPNLWPPSALVPESVFKEPMMAYYHAVYSLSETMFKILAAGLPYGPHIFDEFMSNKPLAVIRPLHYPPSTVPDALGAGAHTDFGAITLLLQDDNAGLQVCDPETKEWMPVPPNRDAYVVNIGDMLEKWTKGAYKSTLHRVINTGAKDRYSIPFFFDGNLECKLVPFDGSEVDSGAITVEDHMKERFASTYVKPY